MVRNTDKVHAIGVELPMILHNRLKDSCRDNGYNQSFLVRAAIHTILEMTHEERINAHRSLLTYCGGESVE